jgi:hypothetical protein
MPDRPAAGAAPLRVLVAEDHGLMLEAILNRLQSDPEVAPGSRATIYTKLGPGSGGLIAENYS